MSLCVCKLSFVLLNYIIFVCNFSTQSRSYLLTHLSISKAECCDILFTEDGKPSKKEDVHVPAINLGAEKKTKELKEKMALMKERRKQNQKLG